MSLDYSLDEDTNDVGKSSTLLGFIDVPFLELLEEEEQSTIEDTFIGGQPIWLHPGSRPSDEQLSCGNCGDKMALLLQAFVPLDEELYDRVVYVFICANTRTCSKKNGSVRAFRGILKDPKKMKELESELNKDMERQLKLEEKKKMQIELTKDLFAKDSSNDSNTNSSANPFGSSSNPFLSGSGANPFSKDTNPFAKVSKDFINDTKSTLNDEKVSKSKADVSKKATPLFAEAAKSNAPVKPVKTELPDIELPEYPGFLLHVKNEKFKNIKDPILEKYKHLTEMDVDSLEGGSSSGAGKQKEAVLDPAAAKVSGMLDDRFFEAFSNKLQHNPSQVLRYERGGTPLLYSGRDSVAAKFLGKSITVPKPGYNPSSERQFELQLMPKAIIDLESNLVRTSTNLLEGMEWGTIIVATDVDDYIPEYDNNHVGYVEEWVGVQWEES